MRRSTDRLAGMTSVVKICTWNVNSVKARLPHLLAFLKEQAPDIALLQETKCTDDAFPRLEIEELGYNLALSGEKSYNGVAILSKTPVEDITRGLPGDDADAQARYIEAVTGGKTPLRVASVYVPNGQEVGSDKFAYKLRFLERLQAHIGALLAYEEWLVLGGDYNVAPEPADVWDPVRLDGTVCYHPDERARLRAILHLGVYDAYRLVHPADKAPSGNGFTWWDYRARGFEQNHGMRIDHLLLSPQAADRLQSCEILKELRTAERASDHVPVVCRLA